MLHTSLLRIYLCIKLNRCVLVSFYISLFLLVQLSCSRCSFFFAALLFIHVLSLLKSISHHRSFPLPGLLLPCCAFHLLVFFSDQHAIEVKQHAICNFLSYFLCPYLLSRCFRPAEGIISFSAEQLRTQTSMPREGLREFRQELLEHQALLLKKLDAKIAKLEWPESIGSCLIM